MFQNLTSYAKKYLAPTNMSYLIEIKSPEIIITFLNSLQIITLNFDTFSSFTNNKSRDLTQDF